jgi:hypothetical protein
MSAQRPDVDAPVVSETMVSKLGKVIDVDEHLGRRESELDHRDQALATSEDLGATSSVGEEGRRLL